MEKWLGIYNCYSIEIELEKNFQFFAQQIEI